MEPVDFFHTAVAQTVSEKWGTLLGEPGQMPYLLPLCAKRAFTSFLIGPVGSLVRGKVNGPF